MRAIAEKHGLATAEKKDSTGICFIGERNFREFLGDYIAYKEGNLETLGGKVVGTHLGAPFYTIGQRKGLKIADPERHGLWLEKTWIATLCLLSKATIIRALPPSLTATDISWISEVPEFPLRCTAKIRYRQEDQACTVNFKK